MIPVYYVISSIIGLFLAVFLPPLYDGVRRKIKARIHCRVGPPIMQTWFDLVKLGLKENVAPKNCTSMFLYAPYLSISYLVLAAIMMPLVYYETALKFTFDIIVLLYLLSSATIILIFGFMGSGNVFSYIGARRELILTIITELTVIFSFISLAIKYRVLRVSEIYSEIAGSPSVTAILVGILLIVCAYVEGFRFPFELPEAEVEIAGGTIIEYSGRRLALVKLSIFVKQFLLVAFAVNILEPWSITHSLALGIPIFIVKTFIVYIVYSILDPLFARYRLDMALRTLIFLIFFMILCFILAIVGV